MIVALIYFLALLIAIYGSAMWVIIRAWDKLPTHFPNYTLETPAPIWVSVIVPARNEAENLPNLLEALAFQSYPQFEVIIVNDHSDDDTKAVTTSLEFAKNLNIKVVELPMGKKGKKQAITHGISHAIGELILTTDADCTMGMHWVKSIVNYYQQKKPLLISGPVRIQPKKETVLAKMQAVEFASLIGVGAASMALHQPWLCNGANLAYPKWIFEEVNGFEGSLHIASGDDTFLLQKINKAYPYRIQFLKDANAIVSTSESSSLNQFFQQRKRWASKWNANRSWQNTGVALFIFLLYATWLITLILAMAGEASWVFFLIISLYKLLYEVSLLTKVLHFLRLNKLVYLIPVLFIIYPFYAVFFGVSVQFGKNSWKGRTL